MSDNKDNSAASAFNTTTKPDNDRWSLVMPATSMHFKVEDGSLDKRYNNRNFGLGVDYSLSKDFSVQAGYYKNSYDNAYFHKRGFTGDTAYVAAAWTPLQHDVGGVNLKAGLTAGVTYSKDYARVAPKMSRGDFTFLAGVHVGAEVTAPDSLLKGVGIQATIIPRKNVVPVCVSLTKRFEF